MSINRLGLAALSLSCVIPAAAETYQWELEADYLRQSHSGFSEGDSDSYGISATYYFDPVEVDGLPLGEAAFLNRASNMHVDITRSSLQSSFQSCLGGMGACDSVSVDRDATASEIGGEFYSPNGWLYMSGRYSYLDSEERTDPIVGGRGAASQSSDFWTASVGIMPMEGLLISTRFNESDSLLNEDWNISAKYVLPMGRQALSLTSTYYEGDGYNDWSVGGDFYFTSHFSVGGQYSDNGTYQVRTEAFFNDSSSVSLSYQERDEDYSYQDAWRVGLKTRF